MIAGLRSVSPFQTLRTSSYEGSPGLDEVAVDDLTQSAETARHHNGTCHPHFRVTSPDFALAAELEVRQPLLVGTYGQFCPVARGAEVFAERWTPLIVRELLRGPAHFNDLLRGLPRISHSLLSDRLAKLERVGIVKREPAPNGHGHEYRLTKAGQELDAVIGALGTWAYKWVSRDLTPDNLDPVLLMRVVERRIRVGNLPPQRVVVRFRFRRLRVHAYYWLVLERPQVELCFTDPGFDVDLFVDGEVSALTQIYLAQLTVAAALRRGELTLTGPAECRRAFASWIGVTPYASEALGSEVRAPARAPLVGSRTRT
jgi:DNA-binding HxlR family transcriptional regulator